jgi:DNA-binding CsgD family transcriptional regulator
MFAIYEPRDVQEFKTVQTHEPVFVLDERMRRNCGDEKTLAAAGLSNKQIGERPYPSPRTVSTHLYQLFPKLGVTCRAALSDAMKQLELK